MPHSHHQLWTAVRDLAALWAATPTVAAMAAELPANAPHLTGTDSATVTSRLQGLKAGAGSMLANPLHVADAVENLRDDPWFKFGDEAVVDDATLDQWLDHAHSVQNAHAATHEWLRSRLPGYPVLRIPYLGPTTHLTLDGPFNGHTWDHGVLSLGLQLQSTVPVASYLGADSTQHQTAMDNALNALVEALKASPEWQTFVATRAALDDTDRTALTRSKTTLKTKIAAFLDSEPTLGEARETLQHYAHELTSALPVNARNYCEAFDAANTLLDLAACEVFGQLVAFGDPQRISPTRVDLPSPGVVTLELHDAWRIDPGAIVHIDDPLVPDALQVRDITHRFDDLDLRPSTITAKMLCGTGGWFDAN